MAGPWDNYQTAPASQQAGPWANYQNQSTQTPTQAPAKRTWLDSVSDAAGEWWKQVNPVTAVQGLAQATNHPIDTANQMGQAQGDVEQKAEAAFKRGDYAEGVRHVLNYLIPVLGPQIDEAGDQAQQGNYAKAFGQTSGIATNIVAPEVIKGITARLPVGELPQRMYQSALKPSTTLPAAQVKSIVNTGVEEGIPVSAEGSKKLGSLIQDYSDKVKAQIQSGSNSGATIDPRAVATRADQARAQFATQVNPNADLQAIDSAKQEFLQNNPAPIPAADAQAIKQGTYTQLKGKSYGEIKTATVEAQKALARGIKEELEAQFPEIKGLNAQQGKLIGLDSALDRAIKRIDNHQLFGIGTPLAAGAGAAVAGGPGAASAAILKLILDDPVMKSKLAIALNYAGKGGITVSAAAARVAGYANALGNALPSDSQSQSAP